jgi:hypothetical protein
MKKTIILLLVLMCAVPVFGLESISVYGRLVDYAWAHSSDELALLLFRGKGIPMYIFTTDLSCFCGPMYIPASLHL